MSVALLTLLALVAAHGEPVSKACSNEIELLCKGQSGEALAGCLDRNYDNATRACRAALKPPPPSRRVSPWGSEAVARPKARNAPAKSGPARLEEGPGLSE